MSAVLYTCPVPGCEAVVTLEKAGIDDLLEELRERAHFPGRWSGRQCDELKELAERMNPPPICP